jgi:hypothetical protein
MTILDAIKNEDTNARVSYGDRWLIYNDIEKFMVYGRRNNQKISRVYYEGTDEEEAIKELLNQ